MLKNSLSRFILCFLFHCSAFAQTPCENGFAGEYPCNGIDLLSHVPITTLANENNSVNGSPPEGSDIWGWVDSTTQKEYAIAAMTNSTAFIDITDPVNPLFLGRLDSNANNNFWRDVKIYKDHAYIVADNVGSHGMQVFDLTRLRNITSPESFTADTIFTEVGSCHNIVINEDTGIAYLVGCRSTNGGGPIFVDLSDPKNPKSLGDYTEAGYSHDAQVITYKGPDTDYTGKEIYLGSNEDEIVILDVTDKENVKNISSIAYSQLGYTHQGWFTEDQKYFLLGDELDEDNFGMNTRTLIFDLQDLDNPTLRTTYFGTSKAIDHNGYVKDNEFYMANYTAGIRILDVATLASNPNSVNEIAYFDTYPENDNTSFAGAWSVYPYFPSGTIIINDINKGLFVVRKNNTLSTSSNTSPTIKVTITPNPTVSNVKIAVSNGALQSVVVYTILGKKILAKENINENQFVIPLADCAQGMYIVKINNNIVKKVIKK